MQALDDLSLRVERGQVLALVGPNGAGKTTLIDVVCGLVHPEHGRVIVLGHDSRQASREIRRRIGVLPQETALYDDLDARQNLRFAADLYGVPEPERRINEVLELVGLAERRRDPVRILSGGMQRRLAIARALLHDPPLLILDEPTLGVDVEARHQIWQHIRDLRSQGRTVLLATNYLDEAEALCDRVAILREGRLMAQDRRPQFRGLRHLALVKQPTVEERLPAVYMMVSGPMMRSTNKLSLQSLSSTVADGASASQWPEEIPGDTRA